MSDYRDEDQAAHVEDEVRSEQRIARYGTWTEYTDEGRSRILAIQIGQYGGYAEVQITRADGSKMSFIRLTADQVEDLRQQLNADAERQARGGDRRE